MTTREVSPAVLKNRGVPLRFHVLAVGEDGNPASPYARKMDGDAETALPVFEERFVQFTSAVLVDMENPDVGWKDLDAWEDALSRQPTVTLVRTLALVLGLTVPGRATAGGEPVPDLRRVGVMMLDGEIDEYATAIGAAFMLAQGISPERAGEALRAGVKNAAEVRPLIDAEIQKMLAKEQESIEELLRDARGETTPTSPDASEGSPGGTGSTDGAEPVVPSTSSGS